MEFSELLFDLYFLSTQIQGWGNDLSGLEFADERGHLDEGEVDRLRETERRLAQAQKLAKARLAEIRQLHGADFSAHLDVVESRLAELEAATAGPMREFDRLMLSDLKTHLAQVRRNEETKFSVWWGFFYIRRLLGESDDCRFTARDLPEKARPVEVCCPACAGANDLTGALDLFLPPTVNPYGTVTLLDEYLCRHCRQPYRALLKVHLREPRGVEIVNVDFPQVRIDW